MFDIENYFNTSSKVISELKIHKDTVYSIAKKIINCKKIRLKF